MTDTIESLSRTTIDTLDPTGKGAIPCCPRCVGILRTQLPQRTHLCDRHGEIPPHRIIWLPYRREDQP